MKKSIFGKNRDYFTQNGRGQGVVKMADRNFSPSLMHTVNDYLSDVGSKKAVSVMVLEKNVPPIVSFFHHGHILVVFVAYTFLSIIGCRQCSPILVYANFREP